MIPFSDPDAQFDLMRHRLDDLIREAGDRRRARENTTERPRRTGRWPRLRRTGRTDGQQPLAS